MKRVSSRHGEAAVILMCLLTFLPVWVASHPERRPGEQVLLHSDSAVAVSVWNTQRGREKMLPYLRVMERLCAFYNIVLQLRFVRGIDNAIVDTISRLQDSKMCAELRAMFPDVKICATVRQVWQHSLPPAGYSTRKPQRHYQIEVELAPQVAALGDEPPTQVKTSAGTSRCRLLLRDRTR